MHGGDVVVCALLPTVLENANGAVAPTPNGTDIDTTATNAVESAVKETILDGGDRVHGMAYDTTSIVVADVERGGDGATLNQVAAMGKAHNTRCVIAGRSDSTRHGQVLDRGAFDVMERCHALLIGASACRRAADADSQCLSIAKESAAEGTGGVRTLLAQTYHRRNADAVVQLDVFAVEGDAIVDVCGECVPFGSIVQEVWAFSRACA